jgi:hypothetical protein
MARPALVPERASDNLEVVKDVADGNGVDDGQRHDKPHRMEEIPDEFETCLVKRRVREIGAAIKQMSDQ